MRFLLTVFALFSGSVFAADANQPHEHQGTIKAYPAAPPANKLTRPELMKLRKGEPVLKQQHDGDGGGRGVAVFRVNASRDKVMSVILDFPLYVNWVDKLTTCEVYSSNVDRVFVRMVTRAMAMNVEWFIEHTVNRKDYWVTWTLDYSRNSDLDDSVGYWSLKEVAGQPGVTQVEYAVDIRLKGWVPGFVKKILVNQGLQDATSWVKVQAESR
jgi:hypothetical protein